MKFSPIFFVSFALVLVAAASDATSDNAQRNNVVPPRLQRISNADLNSMENHMEDVKSQISELEWLISEQDIDTADLDLLKSRWSLLKASLTVLNAQNTPATSLATLLAKKEKMTTEVTDVTVTNVIAKFDVIKQTAEEIKEVIREVVVLNGATPEQFVSDVTAAGQNVRDFFSNVKDNLVEHNQPFVQQLEEDFPNGWQSFKEALFTPAETNTFIDRIPAAENAVVEQEQQAGQNGGGGSRRLGFLE